MNSVGVLSCLSLLLAAAVAQDPKPCVSPELMTGGFTVMSGEGLYTDVGKISYDALGQRARTRSYGMSGNHTVVDQLILVKEKVYYDIDWSNFSCQKRPLDVTFNPMQVPADAKLMGQVFMGSSSGWGMGVLINNWYGFLPGNGMYQLVFTEIGCIPMTVSVYTPVTGWTAVSTYNWVLGNTDPMEYIPPFFCAKAKLQEEETPANMFTALTSLAIRSKKDN
ncbi:uncharacterized protein V6R79_021418 [Siganus canaliculatus]